MRGRKAESDKQREYNNKGTMAEENMLRKGKEERAEESRLNKSDFCLLSRLSVDLNVQYSVCERELTCTSN